MRLRTRLATGLILSIGGVLLWIFLFGDVMGPSGLAIVATAIGISLVGHRLPGLHGLAIGVVVGGFVGTLWLPALIQNELPVLVEAYPADKITVPVAAYPTVLLAPAATYGLAGFVLGRRLSPAYLVVAGLAVAGSAFMLPPGQDQLLYLTGYVVAPVVIAGLTLLGASIRRPATQVEP